MSKKLIDILETSDTENVLGKMENLYRVTYQSYDKDGPIAKSVIIMAKDSKTALKMVNDLRKSKKVYSANKFEL